MCSRTPVTPRIVHAQAWDNRKGRLPVEVARAQTMIGPATAIVAAPSQKKIQTSLNKRIEGLTDGSFYSFPERKMEMISHTPSKVANVYPVSPSREVMDTVWIPNKSTSNSMTV